MTEQMQRDAPSQQGSIPFGLERLFTIDQLARLGGPKRAKLFADIRAGRLKTMKFGRSTRVSESAWRAYLELASSP
jgi:hypothetical protein